MMEINEIIENGSDFEFKIWSSFQTA